MLHAYGDDAGDRGEETARARDEREDDCRDSEARKQRNAEDHRADVLGGGGLEEVGAASGAVADVVADEVGDHRRVARVVFGDAGLDLADEVGADVGGLGVDAAAELREERHEAGAEREADELEGNRSRRRQAAEEHEQRADPEERARHDGEPCAAPLRSARRSAPSTLARAALATRTLACSETNMPQYPAAPEQTAPTTNATVAFHASSAPVVR